MNHTRLSTFIDVWILMKLSDKQVVAFHQFNVSDYDKDVTS
jgi:hypothetical protein